MTNIDELKSTGLKATLPRLKILEIFQKGAQRHMTAEDVFRVLLEERSDIGLATVYRVLTQFEQAGILIRSNFESGKAVYELDEGKHHDHFVCTACGKVEEFYDPEIEKRQQAGGQGQGLGRARPLAWHCTATAPSAPKRAAAATTDGHRGSVPRSALLHGTAVALDEFLVGINAAQLQDGVAHRRLHQHGDIASGHHLDDDLANGHPQHILGQRLIGEALVLALQRFLAHQDAR